MSDIQSLFPSPRAPLISLISTCSAMADRKMTAKAVRPGADEKCELRVDTRRFGAVFDMDVPEDISVNCGDGSSEEDDQCTMSESQWEFHATVASHTTQASDTPAGDSTVESCSSTLSAAQQVVAHYRALELRKEQSRAYREKELPPCPDDSNSMIPESTLDMAWRPPPKIHIASAIQQELDYAKQQAREMVMNAGLSLRDRVQCRRQGCSDVLENAEALKYHLHFHNIGDAMDGHSKGHRTLATNKSSLQTLNPSAQPPSKVTGEYHNNARSKQPSLFPVTSSRKPSIGSGHQPRPSLSSETRAHVKVFSPHPTPANMLDVSVLASTVTPVRSPCKEPAPPAAASANRHRRTRTRTMSGSKGCSRTNLPFAFPPVDSGVFMQTEDPITSPGNNGARAKSPERARSPIRAKSPFRAKSPIRDGLKCMLSIACIGD
ncbi:hypothetical protein F5J12DRAFT_810741 [Pisolithus orientalis]|uniref:uncharacterized protein n=1 Tax=Pisolithus orientalis TaxID=936130 RepID=UPI0022245D26|nr:uncharacterized protein F5J12DRAFT_810741 [Pisolithus orientalis]KAI6025845.1 hypothetical protein F5J12DRAFT_810741 [Pisolithus orientalis]